MSDGFTIRLPFPPSVNRYWRTWRGRMLLSEAGRAYQRQVAMVCLLLGVRKPVTGRLAVDIIANPPDHRKRDIDNLFKAVLDGLAHAGVYANDEQIDDLRIRRGVVGKPGGVVVTVTELKGSGQ